MAYCGITISSDNLSGQTVHITFEPCSGGTIDLGNQTLPYIYTTNYWYGTYNCYSLTYDYNYVLDVPCPPTPTPTTTVTPTPTPAVVYTYNLWTDGVMENACSDAGFGPSNVTFYSTATTFNSISVGEYIYGNLMLTIPPTISTNMISDGADWIQVSPSNGIVLDTGICP
jgi:hypothetical protein